MPNLHNLQKVIIEMTSSHITNQIRKQANNGDNRYMIL